MKLFASFLSITFLSISCISKDELPKDVKDYDLKKVPYKLFEPTEEFKLHYDLQEISGLTYLSTNKLGAIEDETGKLYIINANTGEVEERIKFEKGGDYEGVELVKDKVIVMKSNGHFYRFNYQEEDPKKEVFRSDFSIKNDLEGLAVWNDKLLIACKADAEVNDNKLNGKALYVYDFDSLSLLLNFNLDQLKEFIKKRKYFNAIKDFDPSAIAVRPETLDIYILSADHALAVFDQELNLKDVVKLDKKIFYQPEGICFSPDGQLFISSEGGENRGRLFTFNKLTE